MPYKIDSYKKIDKNLITLIDILTEYKLIIGYVMVLY